MDAVVAQITHPAVDRGLREALRTLGVACAHLAQQRDQGVADQGKGIALVEQQDQGLRRLLTPLAQHDVQLRAGP
jgi:hypothetical protein